MMQRIQQMRFIPGIVITAYAGGRLPSTDNATGLTGYRRTQFA